MLFTKNFYDETTYLHTPSFFISYAELLMKVVETPTIGGDNPINMKLSKDPSFLFDKVLNLAYFDPKLKMIKGGPNV
jgi:hypothetical protein